MKVGFGAGKKKKGGGKGKKKGGKGKKKGADAAMHDAPEQQPEEQEAEAAGGGGERGATAKERQRGRMALKHALKVKVAGLKAHRNKLTKLAGNKDARRSLSKEVRSLVSEQLALGGKGAKKAAGGKQQQQQPEQQQHEEGEAMMAE